MEFKIGGAKKQRRIIIFCLRMKVTIERSTDAVQFLGFSIIPLGITGQPIESIIHVPPVVYRRWHMA